MINIKHHREKLNHIDYILEEINMAICCLFSVTVTGLKFMLLEYLIIGAIQKVLCSKVPIFDLLPHVPVRYTQIWSLERLNKAV